MIDILYIIGQLDVGGTETQLLALVGCLDRSSFRPHVACLSEDAALAAQFRHVGCGVHVVSPGISKWNRLFWLLSVIRTVKPQIVQAIGWAWYLGIFASILARIPIIVASERTVPKWKSRRHQLLDHWLLRRANLVTVNAEAVKKYVVQDLGVRSDMCRVVPNGIDLDAFDNAARMGLRESKPRKARRDCSVVCVVANLRPEKRLNLVLDAYRRVTEERRSVAMQLWLVGQGTMQAQLANQSCRTGIQDQAVFWGYRDDVPAILTGVNIGVLASRTEGLPNVILEYMAAGLPVVATRVAGTPELVMNGETGFLVPPGSPDALAEAIAHLLNDPSLAVRMGKAGRAVVERRFSLDLMVKQTQAVYHSLLKEYL